MFYNVNAVTKVTGSVRPQPLARPSSPPTSVFKQREELRFPSSVNCILMDKNGFRGSRESGMATSTNSTCVRMCPLVCVPVYIVCPCVSHVSPCVSA